MGSRTNNLIALMGKDLTEVKTDLINYIKLQFNNEVCKRSYLAKEKYRIAWYSLHSYSLSL